MERLLLFALVTAAYLPATVSSQLIHGANKNFHTTRNYINSIKYIGTNAKEENNRGVFESPGYPSIYPSNINASWLLNSPPGYRIRLIVNNFEVEYSEKCGYDYLDVYDGNSTWNRRIARLCGDYNGMWLTSSGPRIFLVFVTDDYRELRGFQLEYLTEIETSKSDCITMNVDVSEGVIFSPRRTKNTDCSTIVTSQNKEHQLMLTFANNSKFDVGHAEFYDVPSKETKPLQITCDRFNHCIVLSKTSTVMIHFHSDNAFADTGFIIRYNTIPAFIPVQNKYVNDCEWKMDILNGTIASPNYPNLYGNDQKCIFLLEAPPRTMISLFVEDVVMDGDDQCAFDYLEIRDGHAENDQLLAKLCGRTRDLNTLITSTTNKMGVTFRSNHSVSFKGFFAKYTVVSEVSKDSHCKYCQKDLEIASAPPPTITYPHRSEVILAEGESHLFACTSDNPNVISSWMKDLIPLTTGDQIQFAGLTILPTNSLLVKSMSRPLEGIYTCTMISESDADFFKVKVTYKPSDRDLRCDIKFNFLPQSNVNLMEGMHHFLRCSTTNSKTKITWKKDGDIITPDYNPRIKVILPGLLLINPLLPEDTGTYACIAIKHGGCSLKVEAILRVAPSLYSACGVPKIIKSREISHSSRGKIAAGTEAIRGTSPWQALLWERQRPVAFCSGSLIHRDWVVTAATCIQQFESVVGYKLNLDDFLVKLGKHEANVQELREQIMRVDNIIVHSQYDRRTFDNDIALLHLKTSAEFSDYVIPLCVGERDFLELNVYDRRVRGLITGWGRMSQYGSAARYLREVYLPVVDEHTCKESVRDKGYLVSENMFCAGDGIEGSGDTCKGDSGAPFAVEINRRWYLAGIVSWGIDCSSEGNYGFYTRVGNYYRWIYDIVRNQNSNSSKDKPALSETIPRRSEMGEQCNVTINKEEGIVVSPNYQNYYPHDTDCWTLVKLPNENDQVMATITHFDVEYDTECDFDFVELFDGVSKDAPLLGKFCDSFDNRILLSTKGYLLIHFHSDSIHDNKGFVLTYSSIPAFAPTENPEVAGCIWNMNTLNGTIASPNYPDLYENNQECIFLLEAPSNKKIALYMDKIIMDGHDECLFDFVEVRDGHAEDYPLLAKYCGRPVDLDNVVTSSSNEMWVRFRSDDNIPFQGFKARYVVVSEAPKGSQCKYCNLAPVPIHVVTYPTNKTLAKGKSHLFTCSSDDPKVKPTWMKDLVPLKPGEQVLLPGLAILSNRSLLVKSMSWVLEGVYTCTLASQTEIKVINAWLTYLPTDSERKCDIKFNIEPQPINIIEGMYQFLRCSTTNTDTTITWKKGKDVVTPTYNPRIQVLLPGLLLIHPLLPEDTGIYTCIATKSDGCSLKVETPLQVESKPDSVCGVAKIEAHRKKPHISHGKIVGGDKAIRGTSPWQALLWERRQPGTKAFCGGSLIHRDWVVTAANCITQFEDVSGYKLNLDDFLVKLGKHDAGAQEPDEQVTQVDDIILHPDYDRKTFDNDIALLKLKKPAQFSDYVIPLCVGKRDFLELNVYDRQVQGLVTGWGRTSQYGSAARYLREVYLPVVDEHTCKESVREKGYFVSENMFCAGYAVKGLGDSCKGDTGGPYAVELDRRWYLAGVVSWGVDCSAEGNYGFYTKAGNYYQWIYDNVQNKGRV